MNYEVEFDNFRSDLGLLETLTARSEDALHAVLEAVVHLSSPVAVTFVNELVDVAFTVAFCKLAIDTKWAQTLLELIDSFFRTSFEAREVRLGRCNHLDEQDDLGRVLV